MIALIISDSVLIAILASVPPTIMALATFIQAWRMHKAVNSKMDRFLQLTADASRAEGVKEGEEKQANADSR